MEMKYLILGLILVSVYNATEATMGKKLRWSLVVYWVLVAFTYFLKAGGIE